MPKGGQEVIVGAVTDASFGKLVAFGLGGVLVEVLKDIVPVAPSKADLSRCRRIQAAEMLKGVRGGDAVNRDALADLIVGVSELAERFSRFRSGPEPGLRDQGESAVAADVRTSSTSQKPARYRPAEAEVVQSMSWIMQPKAVAVIGASDETGKIKPGDEEPHQRGYKGQIYPIHPKAAEIMAKAYKRSRRLRARSIRRCSRPPSLSPGRSSNAARSE
jgi:hypothetical protein